MNNQHKLGENYPNISRSTRGAPRNGGALLAGLVLCGRCGVRMEVHYGSSHRLQPYYYCRSNTDRTQKKCWTVPASPIDDAMEKLFLQTMVPTELELSLAVEREVTTQAEALDKQWKLRIEQAEYEARRAERRYKAVDPDNRVVARTLEREWEDALGELERVRQQRQKARREKRVAIGADDRKRIRSLASDLPKVWRASSTPQEDRKAMLALVIEAISLTPVDVPERSTRVRVAWKSGAVTDLDIPRPNRRERRRTPSSSRQRLQALAADGLRDEEIAERLNAEKLLTGMGKSWDLHAVRWARRHEGIERKAPDAPRILPVSARDSNGRYSIAAAAHRYDVSQHTVRLWVKKGLIRAERECYDAKHPNRLVWRLSIDEGADAHLGELAQQSRARSEKRRTTRQSRCSSVGEDNNRTSPRRSSL